MATTKKGELVPRPPRKVEYEIHFATADAQKGWRDLVATIRNPLTVSSAGEPSKVRGGTQRRHG